MKTNQLVVLSTLDLVRFVAYRSAPIRLALVFLILSGGAWRVDAAAPSLTLRYNGPDVEGLQAFELEWDAVSNSTYRVQGRDSLTSGSVWKTVDLASPVTSVGKLTIQPEKGDKIESYYRLVLPQPEIFTVEPAIFPPGAPVDVYVIGQCFETNDVIRVDGVPVAGMVHLNPNQFHGPLPTLSAGRHSVELVRDGVVKSSFIVTCADAVTKPELVLQGPPEAPFASPSRVLKTKTKSNQSNDRVFKPKTKSNQSNDRLAGNPRVTRYGDPLKEDTHFRELTGLDVYVDVASGEVRQKVVDLVIPGRGLDFIWARTYNSRIGRSTAPNGWTFSYDVSIAPQLDGTIQLLSGNGRTDTFYPTGTNRWTRPEYFGEFQDIDANGGLDRVVFFFSEDSKWLFNPLTSSPAPGKLSQIMDRNGNTMKLHYDGAGQLIEVVDDLDRTNTVAYNVAGQIASVTDFSGRTVRYEYDGNGDLVSVISPAVIGTPNGNDFPGGKTNTYTYSSGYLDDRENHLLLTTKDAKGQIQHEHVYQHNQTDLEFLRCISTQRGTNVPTMFTYLPQTPTPANQFATLSCLINDPVGNVTKVYYDARNRPVTLENLTGRATPGVPVTETVNQPTGKLRSSDPDAYVTRWRWNNDSLCTEETLPGGQKLQRLYESDFDAATPARKRADCRVVREIASSPVDVDGDGVADLTERAWRFEYDSRFGSGRPRDFQGTLNTIESITSAAAAKARGIVSVKSPSGSGAPAGTAYHDNPEIFICPSSVDYIDNPEIFICPSSLDYEDFVVSATDPRGNVTKANFDAKGNPIETARGYGRSNVVLESLTPTEYAAHNSHGQLTAITNVADANGYRRVDTFSYYTNGPQAGYLQSCVVDAGGLALTENYEYDARGNLTRCIDPRGNDSLYTYNALDQLVRYQTPTNLTARTTTDFTYDANDNLVRVETERRDENDLIIVSLPSRGKLYQYDAVSRCTEIVRQVSADHFITNRFSYDANNNVVAVHSPLAVSGADAHAITQFAYDERDLPFQTVAAPGSTIQSTTQLDYNANGNVTHVREGLEGTPSITTLEYDAFVVSGVSFDAGARYAAAGASCAWADGSKIAAGSIPGLRSEALATRAKEDTCLRLSKITDPNGNVTTFNYDANDNLKVARHFGQLNDTPGTNGNIRLAESRWKYDGLDRCIEARTAFFNPATQAPIGDGASVTTFAYAPNDQCTNVTDDLGRITRFGYDTAGRHLSTTDARGNIQIAVRDAFGNCITATSIELSDLGGSPQVFSRTNVFDAWNRLVSTTDNVGNNENWSFGGDDTILRSVDARGAITRHEYDLLGRKTKTFQDMNDNDLVEAEDVVVTQAWDDNSRLSSRTDDNTNTTFYAYDSQDRLTQTTYPDGTQASLIWSPRSNLLREQDANGNSITNTYDLLDRLVRRDITPGPGIANTTTFEAFAYDGASRLVAATNDASHSEFEYDSMGNNTGNHSDGWNVLSTFDSVGNRLSLTYPSGRIVTYAYDALNQVTNVSSAASAMTAPTTLASFAYEGPGRLGRIARTNGINTRYTWNGTVFPPNAAGDFGSGQISRINHSTAGGSPVIDQRRFAYDRNQNKIMRAQTASFFAGGDKMTNVFHYDALNRLHETETTLGAALQQVAYALDGNGNRQLVVSNGVALPYFMDNTPPPGPADFQMDQYSMTPFAGQAFDENGNLIAKNSTVAQLQYQYDYANRLVAVNDLITGDAAPVASYSYNALGQRISKTVHPPAPLAPVMKTFALDYWVDADPRWPGVYAARSSRIIEEHVGGVLSEVFVHVSGLKEEIRENDNVFRSAPPLVRFSPEGAATYFHADDLGNVLALTDELGAVAERYEYADFGEVSFLNSDGFPLATNAAPSGNTFLFHGMEWDAETGFYHDGSANSGIVLYGAKAGKTGRAKDSLRYADPNTGRGIGSGGGNLGDHNPWSQVLNVKKLSIKLSFSSSGKDSLSFTEARGRRVTVNGSGAGSAHSKIPAGFVTKKNFGQLAGKK